MRDRSRVSMSAASRTAVIVTAALAVAFGLSGCASGDATSTAGGGTGGSPSLAERFAASSGAFAQNSTPADSFDPADCPPVEIRQGASTLSVTAASRDPATAELRYQGTIAQTARECRVAGPTLTIKVGVQGRIILGPAGGPGQMDVPLRLALVQEGPSPKTIWTKFYNVPVIIPEGQAHVNFMHIEEDLTVPKPNADTLSAYVVYIGFDPLAAARQAPKRPPRKPPAPRR
ncbi:MAG: hypothetical protein H3C55_02585 [Pseudorhodoplanes sp.]|nr:hypothetical protein [Pseudorhodoplanes sp.]MBW7948226.1 hypothetical protein [Pseudorhodoplanes sp.]